MDIKLQIEQKLKEYFQGKGTVNKEIYKAMNYSLEIGGKRVRPMLLIMTYNLYKNNIEEVFPIAMAIEMIHTYSLIHDDLPCMDDDDLRRGYPTNHKVFGEAIAVLAGDGLLNEAMNIMFEFCVGKGEKELAACQIISNSAGADGMIGGQVVDILSEGKAIDFETLSYMHKMKTGALIKASIISGAILAGAQDEDIYILEEFGEKLGLAFQIKDDILDVTGIEEQMGKAANSDANKNKTNFITTFGLLECEKKCKKLTEDCLELLKSLNKRTEQLENLTTSLLVRKS